MTAARLRVNLAGITCNARKVLDLCAPLGVDVVGVTKAVCGSPEVAKAMIAGGIETLGDSRLDNIARMRDAGIRIPMVLLRSPALSETSQCVALAETSLNSDLEVLRALDRESRREGKQHKVILMVDLDTGREGLYPEALPAALWEIQAMEGLALLGLGIYFSYDSEGTFHSSALKRLLTLARDLEPLEKPFPIISGGSSNVLRNLIMEGVHIPGINQLRIGTAILLGISSSVGPVPVPGLNRDSFLLEAEIIEIKRRDRLVGILSLGRLDARPDQLFPTSPGVSIIGASSDHTMVDLTEFPERLCVGDRLSFQLGYYALSRLMLSPYVRVEYLRED